LFLALIALALVGPTAGCASPTDATSAQDVWGFDTGPAGPGLTTHIGSQYVVLYALPEGTSATVVDYVIQIVKTDQIVLHVENFNAANNFRHELERASLPKDVYKMKVFVNKASTPFDVKEITVP
jgi:hypothetical protein